MSKALDGSPPYSQFKKILDGYHNYPFPPDGTWLVGSANRNEISIWRVADGSSEATLSGHTGRITSAAFSPDGKFLASGSYDHSILIWDVSDWSIFRKLDRHASYVNSLAFSSDGKLLISGGEDRRVIVWQWENADILCSLEDPILRVNQVAFSPDGKLIAAASGEIRAYVWLVETGELLYSLMGMKNIYSIAFSPDGSELATESWSAAPETGEANGPIIFWTMIDGSRIGNTEKATIAFSMTYSPDDNLLFSGAELNHSVHIWRASDGSLLRELTGHTDWVTAVAVSPDGAHIASADQKGAIILWGLPEE
jgi:WD40 repeat protein